MASGVDPEMLFSSLMSWSWRTMQSQGQPCLHQKKAKEKRDFGKCHTNGNFSQVCRTEARLTDTGTRNGEFSRSATCGCFQHLVPDSAPGLWALGMPPPYVRVLLPACTSRTCSGRISQATSLKRHSSLTTAPNAAEPSSENFSVGKVRLLRHLPLLGWVHCRD